MRPFIGIGLCISLFTLVGCGGGSVTPEPKNVLTGKVTLIGKTMPDLVMTVMSSDGKISGGMTNMSGEYRVEEPPIGKLSFVFSPSKGVPKKYEKPSPDLTFEYKGGSQTFDIELGKQ